MEVIVFMVLVFSAAMYVNEKYLDGGEVIKKIELKEKLERELMLQNLTGSKANAHPVKPAQIEPANQNSKSLGVSKGRKYIRTEPTLGDMMVFGTSEARQSKVPPAPPAECDDDSLEKLPTVVEAQFVFEREINSESESIWDSQFVPEHESESIELEVLPNR